LCFKTHTRSATSLRNVFFLPKCLGFFRRHYPTSWAPSLSFLLGGSLPPWCRRRRLPDVFEG
jgi:hypothetical protein